MELLCKCGHRDKMHSTAEDALKYYNHVGRMCVEYADYPDPDGSEEICKCNNFIADNLTSIEREAEKRNLV
jgi:hypothetical protein